MGLSRLLVISVFLNIFLYSFMLLGHSVFSFNRNYYVLGAHHFMPDPRFSSPASFYLFPAIAQFDSQWYIKIASAGYSILPQTINQKNYMGILSYAFFPLYPLLLHLANLLFSDILLTSFVVAQLLYLADVASLYCLISRFFNRTLAAKTVLLFFLFPFSIFFRSYYAEGLYIFFLVWTVYLFLDRRYLASATLMSLTQVTKANTVILPLLFSAYLWRRTGTLRKPILYLFISYSLFAAWLVFNYLTTGSFFTFFTIQNNWRGTPLPPLISHLYFLLTEPVIRIHSMHGSKLDTLTAAVTGILLAKSYKKLPVVLWMTSLALYLTPLLSKDLLSFSRFQSLSFPLFLYYSRRVSSRAYFVTAGLFIILLSLTSLYFINWYWIG